MLTHVYMKPIALEMLFHACVEVFDNESSGYLTGRKEILIGQKPMALYYIDVIHPLQTNKRTPVSTEEDEAAASRSAEFLKLTSHVIGGYHSHPSDSEKRMEEQSKLSTGNEGDVQYCVKSIRNFELEDPWLEIIIPIRRRRYAEEGRRELRHTGNLNFSVRTSPYYGYDFRLIGYWVNSDGKEKRADLYTSNAEMLARRFLRRMSRNSKGRKR